jgi:hypothetical protein
MPKIRSSYSILQNYTFKNGSANMGIKLYNKLLNTIKRLDMIQEFKRRLKCFLLQHIFYSVDEYMSSHIGSTITQLFIIMYTLFLVFSNSTKQDTKKLYINVWVLIILYITVFHYWCKCIASSFCYEYCVWMLCNVGNADWAWRVRCHICDWMDWMEE